MKKTCSLFCIILAISACSTIDVGDQIRSDYKTVVFNDGITREEAILIAQHEVLKKSPPDLYVIQKPKVITEFENVPHNEDYWFISFDETTPSSRIPVVYMVALKKTDGKIVFSRSYSPVNEWILEAAFLKLHEKPR